MGTPGSQDDGCGKSFLKIKSIASTFSPDFKGDLAGAFSAAVVTLPMSIGYGFVAFGQLGPELGARAALLGIYCAILAGFFASLLGGSPIQITGPKAPLTLVMASVIAGLLANAHIPPSSPSTSTIVLGLASVCALVAGLSQILTGFLGIGRLLRYVPQPVIAGFMNGIAILLIYKQIRPLLGLNGNIPLEEILADLSFIQPLSLLVGMVTIAVIYGSGRFARFLPPSLIGLGAGTALYYVLKAVAGGAPPLDRSSAASTFSCRGRTHGYSCFKCCRCPAFERSCRT